jgi:amidophosphoribosyltransferase
MCGILGVVATTPVNQLLYDGLQVLQHRGQDAAGIATAEAGASTCTRAPGLVRDVFRTRNMRSLEGNWGIAHCRYPTAGSAYNSAEAQPFYVNSPFGLMLAHNGNLTNAEELKREMFLQDLRHINTNSDSEVLLNVLAHELQAAATKYQLDAETIFKAVAGVHRRVRGAYAVVAMIAGYGLLAFRDPYGIRPLVVGRNEAAEGTSTWWPRRAWRSMCSASRSCATSRPARRCWSITTGREFPQPQCAERTLRAPCIFEFVYLARPDSLIDGISVYESASRWASIWPRRSAIPCRTSTSTSVIPIPDSSRPSAMETGRPPEPALPRGLRQEPLHRPHLHHAGAGAAQEVGAPEAQHHRAGVQGQERAAGRRLDRARHDQQGDRADGARGRRAQGVFRLGRAAGALRQRLRHRHADAPRAHRQRPQRRGDRAARSAPTASSTRTSTTLKAAVHSLNPSITVFETSCFDGCYVTGDVSAEYLSSVENQRNDKQARPARIPTPPARPQPRRGGLTGKRYTCSFPPAPI